MRLLASSHRPTFVIVVGTLAGALGLAVACGGTAVIDAGGTGGNGAGSAQGASTTTSMSTSTTTPTGPVTSSSSSGGSCVSCSEYLLDMTETVPFEDLCGYEFNSDTCAPDSSCDYVELVGLCACGDDNGPPGLCGPECQFSCTGMGMDQSSCQDCMLTSCSAQVNDCLADPGTG
jgi:hypothetical protein